MTHHPSESAISTHDLLINRAIIVTGGAVGSQALYLLSDLAGFVSGHTLVVEGGHSMY